MRTAANGSLQSKSSAPEPNAPAARDSSPSGHKPAVTNNSAWKHRLSASVLPLTLSLVLALLGLHTVLAVLEGDWLLALLAATAWGLSLAVFTMRLLRPPQRTLYQVQETVHLTSHNGSSANETAVGAALSPSASRSEPRDPVTGNVNSRNQAASAPAQSQLAHEQSTRFTNVPPQLSAYGMVIEMRFDRPMPQEIAQELLSDLASHLQDWRPPRSNDPRLDESMTDLRLQAKLQILEHRRR
jgi:hypothetical protein